ncbi:MAG: autotransporter assembly complex family protein [Desulfobulbaceae bacterium]
MLIVPGSVVGQLKQGGGQKQGLEVSVTGIEGPLLDNVLSGLSLGTLKNNDRITDFLVRRYVDLAEGETKKSLEPFGYYAPVIRKEVVRDVSGWKIHLDVTPGDPVRVATVDVHLSGPGANDPALEEVTRSFTLKPGDILDHQLYEKGKRDISTAAVMAGYRDAVFTEKTVAVDRRKRSARITLILDTGPLYFFGQTSFDADFINHDLLHRMLPYAEGEPFSPRKIVQLRQSFLNSEYFGGVEVETGDTLPGSTEVPVFIQLQPKARNRFGLGIGYGTDTGFRGSAGWTNRLVNRYGHQLNVELQPSERKNNIGAVYTIPIRDPKKDRLSVKGEWEKETYDNTDTAKINTALSYDHIRENGEYSAYLNFLDEDFSIGRQSGHATLLRPGITVTWRLADDRLRTTDGMRLSLDVSGASREIVSDVSFLQAAIRGKGIVTFLPEWRLIGRFQFGATLIDDMADLPPSLRYYAGGDESVRGYGYKSIGPTDGEGNVLGASHLLTWSVELERTLFGNWSAAVFFDSGDATDSLVELKMRRGAGAGLRWNAPFGQVRLDVANAVGEGGGGWRIHFNVGADL